MLYPQVNQKRSVIHLNGIWKFQCVSDSMIPSQPLQDYRWMSVPSSYNEITTERSIRDYVGVVCYERLFDVPSTLHQEAIHLRIGSAGNIAKVFINGKQVTIHQGGFLPIDVEITPYLSLSESNRLSILVDNRLTFESLPMGEMISKNGVLKQNIHYDFANYSGIHRDVLIYSTPSKKIKEIVIEPVVVDTQAIINYDIESEEPILQIEIYDPDGLLLVRDNTISGKIELDQPKLWDIHHGVLYVMKVITEHDEYRQKFGIRTFEIIGDSLYLNHKKIYLKGFGKHEDLAIIGKGNNTAFNVRDFELMRWIGANSFRTSHYPYAEEIYDLADEYGILIIDEVPAVGFNFWSDRPVFTREVASEETRKNHEMQIKEMISRDQNHPCIVIYSLANEANTHEEGSIPYFEKLVMYTRKLTNKPLMIVEWVDASVNKIASLFDIIGVNRYLGWYSDFGDLDVIDSGIKASLMKYHDLFHKPILLSEFGADALPGVHSLPSLPFSEEFQVEFIEKVQQAISSLDFVVGEHVWNFADFMTKPGLTRMMGNKKGVFTRDRQPKMVAHYLRSYWEKSAK